MDNVPVHLIVALERQNNAVFEQFRDSADPLFQVLIDDVRLLKFVVRIVDDHRDPVVDVVTHELPD